MFAFVRGIHFCEHVTIQFPDTRCRAELIHSFPGLKVSEALRQIDASFHCF